MNDESRIRYRARRAGFTVVATRGRENKRREEAGTGAYMLLASERVALFSATLDDIADFLKAHNRASVH